MSECGEMVGGLIFLNVCMLSSAKQQIGETMQLDCDKGLILAQY